MKLEKEIADLKKKLKEAEITIARSRSRDSLARQVAKIGYFDFTPATGYLQWSPEVLNLIAGLPSEEIDTSFENFMKFVHEEDRAELNRVVEEAIANNSTFHTIYRVTHEDGSLHWLDGWGGPVENDGNEMRIIGALIDITDQKKAEMELKIAKNTAEETLNELKKTQSQILQSEKMATIGQLTAGVAHELNNPINFISIGAAVLVKDIEDIIELLRRYEQLSKEENQHESIKKLEAFKKEIDITYLKNNIVQATKDIEMGANRTVKIIKGLRSFSRLDTKEKTPFNVHTGIEDTLSILNSRLKDKVNIVTKFDNSIEHILCSSGQLNQVFMNLIINAEQAIAKQGTIIIQTKNLGDKISISIKDDGIGIDEKIIDKIFEPFFTTKPIGLGTGLGLSISHGIIKNHGGTITVNSSIGKGSVFEIILPKE